jgi:hypothetical protein
LQVVHAIELAPDAAWDEITLQWIECRACGFAAPATYLESRRGALGSELVHHDAYLLQADDAGRWKSLLSGCPQTKNSGCSCEAHALLGRQDSSGRWIGLNEIAVEGLLPIAYDASA